MSAIAVGSASPNLDVRLLERSPVLAATMARALAVPRRAGTGRGAATLQGTRVALREVTTPLDRLAAYNRVTGFGLTGALPSTWVHVLTFPLQVEVMADRRFPFPMLGMVHVANRIEQHRPVGHDEPLTLMAWADGLRPHPRGATVDLVGEARVADDVVWRGVSTYLVRGASAPGGGEGAPEGVAVAGASAAGGADELVDPRAAGATPSVQWRVPADIGRRYAGVSGDVNPIHLSPLTAKALGFPRTLAHGMWTHARALAALQRGLPEAYAVEVGFRKPLLVPATVAFSTAVGEGGRAFSVTSRDGARVHVTGLVTPL